MKGPLFVYDNPLVGLSGAYLSRLEPDGSNPGDNYIRVALIHPPETTKTALEGILKVLR